MNIGDMIKNNLKILEAREKEIKKELTRLHNLRYVGKQVETIEFKNLHDELNLIREKIKGFKKLVRGK